MAYDPLIVQVSPKAPPETHTEIQMGDPLAPAGSDWGSHTGLQMNYGSTTKITGGFEPGRLCPRCGQMFKESEMVKIGSQYYCLPNGDAQDEIAERLK